MNTSITWNEQYSINIPSIDEQHKYFIKLCNDLYELGTKESVNRQDALIGIMKFGDYTAYHLAEEEEFLIKVNSPDAFIHVHAHSQFREKINEYVTLIRNETSNVKEVTLETAQFASSWLLEHIELIKKNSTHTETKLRDFA